MIFEIILLVLVFGLMFFLILKATKKIFETIFIVLGIFILFSCGILGLGYLEFKKISSYEEIDLNIYYGELEDLKFGVSFSFDVEEKEIDTKNVEVLTDLDKQSVKDLEENEFSILITKKALENILPNGSKYDVLKIFQIEELKRF